MYPEQYWPKNWQQRGVPIKDMIATRKGARWYRNRKEHDPPKGVDEIMSERKYPFEPSGKDYDPCDGWQDDSGWCYSDEDYIFL